MPTRAEVVKILDDVAKILPIRSDLHKQKFDYYVGPFLSDDATPEQRATIHNWQERLEYDWKKKRPTTCCNQFAGQVIRLVRGPYLGGISLRGSLDAAGYSDAWTHPSQGTPKSGDLLQFTGHVGVAYGNQDDGLQHIDAGQGTVGKHDMIALRTGGTLIGFVDIDKVFDGKELPPAWAAGWWHLTWSGTKYWYYIGPSGLAQYQKSPPKSAKALPNNVWDSGAWVENGSGGITIKWRQTGSIEKWTPTPGTMPPQMVGDYNNRSATLYATKVL